MCHSTVLASGCGSQASRVMSSLINDALHDPLYLRLGHRANCDLHRPPTQPPTTTTMPTPVQHRVVAGDAELRPSLTAIFPDSVENTKNVEADEETNDNGDSSDQRPVEADEETIQSPKAEDANERETASGSVGGDTGHQHHGNYGLDVTGHRDVDNIADDDEYQAPHSGRSSPQNDARPRGSIASASSSVFAAVRQVSLLSPVTVVAVACVLWTASVAGGQER
jgi:hypothetical protein